MLNRLLSWGYFKLFRFAHAAAFTHHQIDSDRQLWSYYRLGMYATAANAPFGGEYWHGLFAKAVSLAACGRHHEAELYVRKMQACEACKSKLAPMADALAPFMPVLAYEVLSKVPNPSIALQAALMLEIGKQREATTLLRQAFEIGEQLHHPELNLYKSNAMRPDASEQLDNLNAFLAAYDLPGLALKDSHQPPSPINVRIAAPVAEMDGPLLSVLMTTYKTGRRADIAIASVLQQSYRNLELIIVDDESNDETVQIIRSWAKRDKRIKFIPLECNVGTFVAKSIGFRHAQGEFVTCHDSDDWSHPLKLERQVRPLLRNPLLVATVSLWVRMQDDGRYYARPVHPLVRLNPSSPLFRRKRVLKHAGLWDAVRTGADSEFLARLKLIFGKAAVKRVALPLSLGAHREESLMTAAATGYSTGGLAPQRLAYWEAWGRWHIETLRSGKKPYMPTELTAQRAFDAPGSILVPQTDIVENLLCEINAPLPMNTQS